MRSQRDHGASVSGVGWEVIRAVAGDAGVMPGELLARLVDAAETAGIDESHPRDVARVLTGSAEAAPAALRIARRLTRMETDRQHDTLKCGQ